MPKLLATFKKAMLDEFLENNVANLSNYYLVACKPTQFADDANPPENTMAYKDYFTDPQREMLFGKRIGIADIAYMVNRHDWVANSVYVAYDDAEDLSDEEFFVITSARDVYKCLDNADGGRSTEEPSTYANTPFTTSDGYKWKYMFSIPSANATKFMTDTFIPVQLNANVQSTAIAGIDRITINSGGAGYSTYANGSIQSRVSSTVYRISNESAGANDYYNKASLYITGGTGEGEQRQITDYVVNATGKFVTVDSAFSANLTTLSTYYIAPHIKVVGDGSGFIGYPEIDPSTNSISAIVVSNPGTGYTQAEVTIEANNSFGTGASLRAVIPPYRGHGYDPAEELYCSALGIGITFANTEAGTIPTQCTFRQLAVLKNPTYANGTLYSANTFDATTRMDVAYTISGQQFQLGEKVSFSGDASADVVYANTSTLIVAGVIGAIANSATVTGETSRVRATVTGLNSPTVSAFSGEVLYIENLQPIQRSNTTSESVKLVIKL